MEPEQSDHRDRDWHNSQRHLFSSLRSEWVCFSFPEQMNGRQFFGNFALVLLSRFLIVKVSVHDYSPFMKNLGINNLIDFCPYFCTEVSFYRRSNFLLIRDAKKTRLL
jgi:hypothetical protein